VLATSAAAPFDTSAQLSSDTPMWVSRQVFDTVPSWVMEVSKMSAASRRWRP